MQRPVQSFNSLAAARPTSHRPGIALMLVLISVGVVTVASIGFLAASGNAPEIGSNAVLGARARAAADTGIDLAEAIMQCSNIDWRSAATDGVLVENFDYGGETITITVTDLDGNLPAADCEYVTVTANGKSNKMVQGVMADVYTPQQVNAVGVDMREFAVFVRDWLKVTDSAILRWQASPRFRFREPIRIGTNSLSGGNVALSGNTCLVDTSLYVMGVAPKTILADNSAGDTKLQRVDMTADQPLPLFLSPAVDVSGLPPAIMYKTNIASGTWYLSASKMFESITVTDTANLKPANAGMTAYILRDLKLDNGGRITIDHDMTIVVEGDVSLDHESHILVENGARLDLHVGGNFDVNHGSSIGLSATEITACGNPYTGLKTYSDPRHVRVLKLRGSTAKPWVLDNNSAMRGIMYGAEAKVKLDHMSFIAGCIIALEADIMGDSVLHYDHALDDRIGYTNPNSLLFSSTQVLDSRIGGYASKAGIGTGTYYVAVDGSTVTISKTPSATDVLSGPDLSTPAPRKREVKRRLKMMKQLLRNK
ncbi:MAG: hypothetical protein D8M59_05170 [Planctomycetes bacterium]|nr:hypothetical protein [Planctomycetota bacterium]NOG56028.1 hypothetical protein [Planctomycetota bacterium]